MWEVEYRAEKTACWSVMVWGIHPQPQYMLLHAERGNGNDGGQITLALSESPHFDVYAREQFAMVQSNPRRHGYGYSEDDGA